MPNAPHSVLQTQFFTRREYFVELARQIKAAKPGGRVLLTTMSFDAGDPYIAAIFTELEAAGKRGVSVFVAIDAYDFIRGEKLMGPLWWKSKLPDPQALQGLASRNLTAIQRVQGAGGTCTVVNTPDRAFSNPFMGRSHIKCAVINDFSFVGGCNLHQNQEIDCMVGWQSAKAADWLFNTLRPLIIAGTNRSAFGTRDKQYTLQSGVDLLLDAGIKRQSIILKNAHQLIDDAQQWVFLSCQYFPNGTTAQKLRAAHARGIKVFLLLNSISKHAGVHVPIQRIITPFEKAHSPASFFDFVLPAQQRYLHAKVLANETTAMVGSHNYIVAGVNFGTAELTVRWRNPVFSRHLVQNLINQTSFAHSQSFSFLNQP